MTCPRSLGSILPVADGHFESVTDAPYDVMRLVSQARLAVEAATLTIQA
jgi:hypothetical protein